MLYAARRAADNEMVNAHSIEAPPNRGDGKGMILVSAKHQSLYGFILLACVALVVGLTTLPTSISLIRLARSVTVIAGHPNANDALGHAALYATLTAVVYGVARRRFRFTWAFWLALLAGMLLGAATEFAQQFSPGRTMMLSDLLANWLGVMTVAMLIGYQHGRTLHR